MEINSQQVILDNKSNKKSIILKSKLNLKILSEFKLNNSKFKEMKRKLS